MKLSLLLAGMLSAFPLMADSGPFTFEFEELAPGVWAGVRPDSQRFPVMGSATIVIGDEGVVVFDGGGAPAMADQVIEKIRSETDLPVTHVIISHWHGDHNFGVHRFAEEFPNVEYVAHDFTYRAMNGSNVDYILGYPEFVEKRLPVIQERIDTGKNGDGSDVSAGDLANYRRMVADAPQIGVQYKAAKVTSPTLVFHERMTIWSGSVQIDLLQLGHGNTEGDVVMWLPQSKIAAAGDLVVAPSPYAFNVPPRAWAQTLRNLNALEYDILVPGHGDIQRDTRYVDLIIETADAIADQRDELLAQGVATEEVGAKLDFSAFKNRYTGDSRYNEVYYHAWFEGPLRAAAIKALGDEPMVVIGPSTRNSQE